MSVFVVIGNQDVRHHREFNTGSNLKMNKMI